MEVALLLHAGWAAAETSLAPTLKVSGRASIDAEARATSGGYEIRALLSDEVGRALGGAELRARTESAATLRRCSDARGEGAAEVMVTTDAAGRACVSVTGITAGDVELSYQDARGYFERASRRLHFPHAVGSAFEMGFDPPVATLSLDRPLQELGVVARATSGARAPEGAELAVLLATSGGEVELARSPLDGLGEIQRFTIATASLGEPGPARLVARLRTRSAEVLGRASTAVLRTVTVKLRLEGDATSVETGSVLKVHASSKLGPAPGGVIEARSAGLSIAAAPVRAGTAQLRLPSASALPWSSTLTLEYVGQGPGWLGGAPLEASIVPEGPSYARYALWFAAAVLTALAVVLGWRRPPRPRPTRTIPPPRPRASVELLEAFASGAGYRGVVRDAHDGTPISPAALSILGPGSPGPVLHQASVSPDGHFDLEGATFPAGTVVEVTAPFHATLRAPLPSPGVLELSLVSRRRALLDRLVRWAETQGKPWTRSNGEPTPAHVAATATNESQPQVERWARGMEQLAFGPIPPDAASEIAAGVASDPKLGRE